VRTTAASLRVSRAPRRAPKVSVASRGASRRLRRDTRRMGNDAAAIPDGCSTKIDGSCANASGRRRSSSSTLRSTSGDPAYTRGSDAYAQGCPAHLVGCPAHSRGCSACSSGIPRQTRRRPPRSPSIATASQPSRGDSARRVASSERRRPRPLGSLRRPPPLGLTAPEASRPDHKIRPLPDQRDVLSLHREALSPRRDDLSSDREALFAHRDVLSSPPAGSCPRLADLSAREEDSQTTS
jgi:hypothetical protein